MSELDNLLMAYPGKRGDLLVQVRVLLGRARLPRTRRHARRARATAELAPAIRAPTSSSRRRSLGRQTSARRARSSRRRGKIGDSRRRSTTRGGSYRDVPSMGALTWTEEVVAKAKLDKDRRRAADRDDARALRRSKGREVRQARAGGELVAAVKNSLDARLREQVWRGREGDRGRREEVARRARIRGRALRSRAAPGPARAARAACGKALAADPNESWALYLSGVIALKDTSAGARRRHREAQEGDRRRPRPRPGVAHAREGVRPREGPGCARQTGKGLRGEVRNAAAA